jgi:hypothetical protein
LKVLVVYDEKNYLVPVGEDKKVDYDRLFDIVNKGRWPDECHDKDWIIDRSEVIAFLTDDSDLIE